MLLNKTTNGQFTMSIVAPIDNLERICIDFSKIFAPSVFRCCKG